MQQKIANYFLAVGNEVQVFLLSNTLNFVCKRALEIYSRNRSTGTTIFQKIPELSPSFAIPSKINLDNIQTRNSKS